jgi:hypothetical protein
MREQKMCDIRHLVYACLILESRFLFGKNLTVFCIAVKTFCEIQLFQKHSFYFLGGRLFLLWLPWKWAAFFGIQYAAVRNGKPFA